MKKLIAIVLVALLALSFVACGDDEENEDSDLENAIQEVMTLKANADGSADCSVIYDVNEDGTYEITGLIHDKVSPLHVKISAEDLALLDREITGIADGAFMSCQNLVSIEIPETITYIGVAAFYGCDNLTSVSLPKSVSVIKNNAFDGCSALTSFVAAEGETLINNETVVKGLETIEAYAFRNCTALATVSLPATTLKTIGDAAFKGCSSLTEITIPASVTAVGDGAFLKCEKLASVITMGTPEEKDLGEYIFGADMTVKLTITKGSAWEAYVEPASEPAPDNNNANNAPVVTNPDNNNGDNTANKGPANDPYIEDN